MSALALSGCPLPNALLGPDDFTVGTLLQSGGSLHLIPLKAGAGDVAVPLSPDHEAFLMFNSSADNPARLTVAIRSDGAAALKAPFEQRLRALEAPLREAPPHARYHLAAVPQYQVGATEKFWVIQDAGGGKSSESQITATAAYVGEHCYVFVDNAVPAGRLADQVAQIGQNFDQQIFPTDSRLFGQPLASGVNGDAHISLLVTPAVGNYGQDTTIGYFTVRDLFPPAADPTNPILRHSNQRLMLYISSLVVSKGQPSDYLGTIAHEFEHLINASQKIFRDRPAPTEDVWLDEGLAMYAMEANGYGLKGAGGVVFNHVVAYEANPARYSLTNWDLNPDQSAYGAVYLYTNYLADRFGEGLLRELVASPLTGIDNLDSRLSSRGTSFDQVFTDWTTANLLDHTGATGDARYGYKSLSMLGTYGGKKLRGVALQPVSVPNTGQLSFKPYSAQYYYVPKGSGGNYRFTLSGSSQSFDGLVIVP